MENYWLVFYGLLFITAMLYASVGHGGASGYLALMALFGIAPEVMKPTALLLNLFVSLIAFIQFYRGKHFLMKLFIPLALASMPAAFLGGLIVVHGNIYKQMLGVLLLFPVARFFFFSKIDNEETKPFSWKGALLIGAVIGLLSGMIGIGGGILLSPVLILLKWTNQKQAAALSALFIFVNSAAGLAGQMIHGVTVSNQMYLFVLIALGGALTGAYFGALKFQEAVIKNILAFVLLIASVKLFFV